MQDLRGSLKRAGETYFDLYLVHSAIEYGGAPGGLEGAVRYQGGGLGAFHRGERTGQTRLMVLRRRCLPGYEADPVIRCPTLAPSTYRKSSH
jgi:hypothetical protein